MPARVEALRGLEGGVERRDGADTLLSEEIDRLVIRLCKVQPEFYADYRTARRIVDVRGRRAGTVEAGVPSGASTPAPSGAQPTPATTPPVKLAA